MYFLSHTLSICYFSVFLKLLHGYLLFAANLEDFHAIAKKLVPEQLTSLAKIATKNSPRDTDYDQSEVSTKHVQRGQGGLKSSKIRLSNDATIDFEELVERVKKRLEKELQEKYSNTKNTKLNNFKRRETTKGEIDYSSSQKSQTNADEISDYTDEVTDRPAKLDSNIHITVYTERSDAHEHADALETTYNKNEKIQKDKIKTETEQVYGKFKQIEITESDSYEDYKPPVKDANIHSSNENKRFKIKQNLKSNRNPPNPKEFKDRSIIKEKNQISKPNSDEDAIEDKTRTENIAYDDIGTEKSNVNVEKKSNLGSFIPTPAERYDFDEPLPEKDRERENLKYFGNPPAKINKKVHL